MQNQQPNQPQIDITKTTEVVCEKCKGNIFAERMLLRKASMIVAAASKPQIMPIPVPACILCNHVNKEFLPNIPTK